MGMREEMGRGDGAVGTRERANVACEHCEAYSGRPVMAPRSAMVNPAACRGSIREYVIHWDNCNAAQKAQIVAQGISRKGGKGAGMLWTGEPGFPQFPDSRLRKQGFETNACPQRKRAVSSMVDRVIGGWP